MIISVSSMLCVSHICDKVHPNPPMEEYEHLKGLKLADQFSREESGQIKTDNSENDIRLGHLWKEHPSESNTPFTLSKALGIEIQNEFEVNDILKRFKDEVEFDGERHVVKLQWKAPEVRIPNNYEQAERSLQRLEKSLSSNNERAKEYDEVIKNYMERGWIEEAENKDGIPGKTWYLPHHAVYRNDKTTTRCRIVFDASAKISRNLVE
ncbi:hypothetical protein T06_14228 [Trichinella sp. T6]|nr:hypothetical protein T06_14228 [Trichinella sp. T6]